jgi:hypothetical protein
MLIHVKGTNGKAVPAHTRRHTKGVKVKLHLFSTLALDGRQWPAPLPPKKDPCTNLTGGWVCP